MACEPFIVVLWKQPACWHESFRIGEDVSLAVDEVRLCGYDCLGGCIILASSLAKRGAKNPENGIIAHPSRKETAQNQTAI